MAKRRRKKASKSYLRKMYKAKVKRYGKAKAVRMVRGAAWTLSHKKQKKGH